MGKSGELGELPTAEHLDSSINEIKGTFLECDECRLMKLCDSDADENEKRAINDSWIID